MKLTNGYEADEVTSSSRQRGSMLIALYRFSRLGVAGSALEDYGDEADESIE